MASPFRTFFMLLGGLLLIGCNTLTTFIVNMPCPVSPRLTDHPVAEQMLAPVGEYPVWFVTLDAVAIFDLAQSAPPYNGGTVRKSLVVVSTELSGDLVLTGRQLDGDGIVLFPLRIDEEIPNADGSTTIVYSEDDLTDQFVIPNAEQTTFGTDAPGYAHHPWAVYYPNPGCYQLTGTFGGVSATAIVEIRPFF